MTIAELFEKHDAEYLKFERINLAERFFESPELCALHYIYGLLKDKKKFEYRAEHDVLYLADIYDMRELTEEDVIFLRRCGIHYDEENKCLANFC